jgi:hypothetical protein
MSAAGPLLDYVESPVFNDVEVASFSFAFELYPEKKHREAFRLEQVAEHLDSAIRDALIGPIASYLDDVTTGVPGRHGRPLIALAGAPEASPSVDVRRAAAWSYDAEGATRTLHAGEERGHPFLVREAFCAFKSGRIFYILSLTLPEDPERPIDEYLIIQMQRLAMDAGAATGLNFAYPGNQKATLLGLAETRLGELAGGAGSGEASCIHDILGAQGLLSPEEIVGLAKAIKLRGLCVAIENKGLMEAVDRGCRKFGHGQVPEVQDDTRRPGLVRKLVSSIINSERQEVGPAYPLHNDSEDRVLYALSGLAQGVADFGLQDPAELSEATCPATRAAGYAVFAHPSFLLEIAPVWRTLVNCRNSLGACPYLSLIWLAAIHADLLVSEIEDAIDDMVYDHGDDPASCRSRPLADLQKALNGADALFAANGETLLRDNLARRVTLVGSALMHQSGTLFRYPKEKKDLAATLEVMGTAARFSRARLLLEQVENLVEDVISLRRSYADQRTNALLIGISLLSVASIAVDVQEKLSVNFLAAFAGLLALLLAAVVLVRLGLGWIQERRSRKSS